MRRRHPDVDDRNVRLLLPRGPPAGRVPLTMSVTRVCRPAVIWSACACVSFPAVTAAAISVFSAATRAAISPADDLPPVASATCASVFPDWRSVCN
jgi:hypothetical protein